jgi:hypothetical protein
VLLTAVTLCAVVARTHASPPTRVVTAVGAGGYVTPCVSGAQFSVLGAPQIDARGGVLVTCRFAGTGVVYSGNDLGLFYFDSNATGRMLSRTGSGTGAANGTGVPGADFSATFFPRLWTDGGIAAVCFLSGTGIDSNNSTGYWLGTPAGIGPTLRSGITEVPGVPGANFYGFISGFPCLVSSMGMAFSGQMAVGPGGVSIDDYQGLWGARMDGHGGVDLLARPGIVGGGGAPPLLGASYVQLNPRTLVLANNGRVAFGATLTLGAAGVADVNDTVLVERRADGSFGIAAREGDPVPGNAGLVFKSLDTSAFVQSGGVSINSAGDLAFGDIDGADAPAAGVSRVWRRNAAGRFDLLAARTVSGGPGAPREIAGVFTTVLAPAVNSAGTVVFAGTVSVPGGADVGGLWMCEADRSVPRLVLRSGVADTAFSPPGVAGAMFSAELPARGTYRINSRGQLTVSWKIQDGPGGVGPTNDNGLWAFDPAAGLLAVARSGDAVQIAPGVTGVIRNINFFLGPGGDDDGRLRDLNDLGEVAYTVQFSDNTGAILVSRLPELGACCRGGTCSLSSGDQCAGVNTRFAGIGMPCAAPGACCEADFDQSGRVGVQDIFMFLNAWFAGDPTTDVDGAIGLGVNDIFFFLNAWFAGC